MSETLKKMLEDYNKDNEDLFKDFSRSFRMYDEKFNEIFKFEFENLGKHDGYFNIRIGLMAYIYPEWIGNERIDHHVKLLNTYILEIHYLNLDSIQESMDNSWFARQIYSDFTIVAKKFLKIIEKDFKINVREFDIPYMKLQMSKKVANEKIDKDSLMTSIEKKIEGIQRYKTSFRTFD